MSRNYVLYYGMAREDQLSSFDIAIVEPSGQTADGIKRMKKSGTMVIGYLSMLEISPGSPEMKFLKEKELLHKNGKPIIYTKYGNYWVDLRSETWANMLLHKTSYLLNYLDCDGLFIDTAGYVEEEMFPSDIRQESVACIARVLRRVRSIFPQHILIQNGGLLEIIYYTAPFLNGVCWENPPIKKAGTESWTDRLICNLKKIKKENNLQIFLLVENQSGNIPEIRKTAHDNGFLVYHADQGYTGAININHAYTP